MRPSRCGRRSVRHMTSTSTSRQEELASFSWKLPDRGRDALPPPDGAQRRMFERARERGGARVALLGVRSHRPPDDRRHGLGHSGGRGARPSRTRRRPPCRGARRATISASMAPDGEHVGAGVHASPGLLGRHGRPRPRTVRAGLQRCPARRPSPSRPRDPRRVSITFSAESGARGRRRGPRGPHEPAARRSPGLAQVERAALTAAGSASVVPSTYSIEPPSRPRARAGRRPGRRWARHLAGPPHLPTERGEMRSFDAIPSRTVFSRRPSAVQVEAAPHLAMPRVRGGPDAVASTHHLSGANAPPESVSVIAASRIGRG